MNFDELLEKRYTVRKYTDKKVSEEDIRKILEAGRIAPSAKNLQPLKIYVCTSDEALAKVDSVSPCRYGAPLAFIICSSKEDAWSKEGYSSYDTDSSICTTYMMLESTNLGLSSVWVGMFDTSKTKEVFNTGKYEPVSMLMVGYPQEGAMPSPSHSTRKSIEELAIFL